LKVVVVCGEGEEAVRGAEKCRCPKRKESEPITISQGGWVLKRRGEERGRAQRKRVSLGDLNFTGGKVNV